MGTDYIFGGTTGTMVGRFGALTKGDVVNLTDEEVTSVAGSSQWARKPTIQDKKFIQKNADATLTNAQSGHVINSNHSSAVVYTLPASPDLGCNYDFQFGSGANGDITVARNGKTIDGAASNLTIAQASVNRSGLYYNGTGWITYSA